MLLLFSHWLKSVFPKIEHLGFFRYITVRSALALALAFGVSMVAGPFVIRLLKRLRAGGRIRRALREGAVDVYETHAKKSGTPIMGGILILGSVALSGVILCDLTNSYVLISLGMMLGFGAIGFVDDLLQIQQKDTRRKGLPAAWKLAGQLALGALLAWLVVRFNPSPSYHVGGRTTLSATCLCVPFFKNLYPELRWMYPVFVMLVVCATSNAVNLTDGLDGLAIGITIITSLALAIAVYLVTRIDFATYLYFPYIKGGGDLTVILLALAGAGMGFLWFNSHPAEVFMGDTGSLAIGGLLGTIAVMVKQELLLVIIGGIFVIEAASVIIQVASFKLRGKRVFLMTPLHHHFEKKGWNEAKIIARFWILAALLALLGLSTLKIR